MAKQSVLQHNATSGHLDYQTWILKVYIHCEGCKKKVFKVLQSIDGVYKTEIDSKQHKAIVSGSVDGNTLVQKLLKSGKHAEILPESFEPPPPASADNNKSENSNQKKKQKNKQKNNDVIPEKEEEDNEETIEIDEKKEESETPTAAGKDAGKNPEPTQPPLANGDSNGNGGGKKKKKNKKKKGDKSDGAPEGNGPVSTGLKAEESLEGSMDGLDLNRPVNNNQMVYATPYDLIPPYNNNNVNSYYPTTMPVYGMSYNTNYLPSSESSYYTPPVYGYAQSHPSVYYPPQGGPWYYPRSAFDEEEDKQDGRGCNIM